MEVYLNSIEMGNGIYGAEAASQHWFKKSASRLSQQEAAAIAAILPNPRVFRANPASNYIQSRKAWIVRQMYFFGPLNYDSKKKKPTKH
jgi:monofunctional biosynthetic peptidoglycan transglycosylase